MLEVMVGLVLIGLILNFSYQYLSEILQIQSRLKKIQVTVEKKHYGYIRLNQIFSSLAKKEYPIKDRVFYDQKTNSLHFLFDNGIDPDPNFSGFVQGKIYLAKNKTLCLNTFPLEIQNVKRSETLLENITNMELTFFSIKEKKWKKNWDNTEKTFPIMMQISLKKEDENILFSYSLPTFPAVISYKSN